MNPRLNCRGAAVFGSDNYVEFSVEKDFPKLVGADIDRRANWRLRRRLHGYRRSRHLRGGNDPWRSLGVLLGPAAIARAPAMPARANWAPTRLPRLPERAAGGMALLAVITYLSTAMSRTVC